MKRILVATDGSVLSGKALAKAIELARQFDARLTIVNVMDVVPVGQSLRRFVAAELPATTLQPVPLSLLNSYGISSVDSVEALDSQSRAVAQLVSDRILANAQATAEAAGIKGVDTVSAAGDPAREIVAAVKAAGADLVVVGRRGLGGLNELVLGSVSQKVLHHAAADVMVVA
ncbi:MAG: universal stress protein [Devosia sp.]|nr:universal stress protein [Devosia sp.]